MSLLLKAQRFIVNSAIKAQRFIVNFIIRKTEDGRARTCEDGSERGVEE